MMIELKDGTHVIAPCPTGWGIPVSDTVEAAREIVDCGLWYLAKYENGEYKDSDLIVAWDIFTKETPGRCERFEINGKSVFDIPEMLRTGEHILRKQGRIKWV